MPKKARAFSREMKLAATPRMMAGESVTALARELKLRRFSSSPTPIAQGAEEARPGAPRQARQTLEFSTSDVHERRFWGDYMYAFEEAIRATASERAPWYVVPADNKWFTRLVVAAAIVAAVERLDLAYPTVDAKKNNELQKARAALER